VRSSKDGEVFGGGGCCWGVRMVSRDGLIGRVGAGEGGRCLRLGAGCEVRKQLAWGSFRCLTMGERPWSFADCKGIATVSYGLLGWLWKGIDAVVCGFMGYEDQLRLGEKSVMGVLLWR